MSLIPTKVLTKSIPIQVEGIFIILIGLLIVANTTLLDITVHDTYVLPAIATCFPENQEAFCQSIRARMNLPFDAQIAIGDAYWNELTRQAFWIGLIMFTIRISFGIMLSKVGIRKIRTTTWLMAVMWGLIGSGFFLFAI